MPQEVTKKALAGRLRAFPEETIVIGKENVKYEGPLFNDKRGFGINVSFILDYKGEDSFAVNKGRIYVKDGNRVSLSVHIHTKIGKDIWYYRDYIFRDR